MIQAMATTSLPRQAMLFAALAASRHSVVSSFFSSTILKHRTRRQSCSLSPFYLKMDSNINNNENETTQTTADTVKSTWNHVSPNHYQPIKNNNSSIPRNRYFSTWTVPKTIEIPQDKLDVQFVRSSGAGGQNVNKVNTKVEIRFDVMDATWIPDEVRERLKLQQSNRISKDGILSLTCQEFRTQGQNKKAALDKLRTIILEAWPRPKIRKQRTGISKAAKQRNMEFKKKRSETKQNRKRIDW
ncbi:protein chain release factor B [Nitzschia inconspicua]|uniref:Protein chain release factor B n=1 Tax=Nitzschia inconspicua TaxID=303405 RepID=A0A9K3PFM9_9STRA|nr:protein chain release factor B [Nitzschia inconspicua]